MEMTRAPTRRDIRWPQNARVAVALTFDFEAQEAAGFFHDDSAAEDYRDYTERQFGGREGIRRVLRILEKHRVRCTFFTCGKTLENYPDVSRQVRDAGHEMAGHAYHHEYFDKLSAEGELAALDNMIAAFRSVLGEPPAGFRSCNPSHRTHRNLAEYGFKYDSTNLDDDLPYVIEWSDGKSLLELPNGFGGDASHFGHPVPRTRASGRLGMPSMVLTNWKRDFDMAYREGAEGTEMLLIALHPYNVGHPSRSKALDAFLTHMKQRNDVWFATVGELADWWSSQMKSKVTSPTDKGGSVSRRESALSI